MDKVSNFIEGMLIKKWRDSMDHLQKFGKL